MTFRTFGRKHRATLVYGGLYFLLGLMQQIPAAGEGLLVLSGVGYGLWVDYTHWSNP